MSELVVVENTRRWPLRIPGVEVASARDYLSEPRFSERRGRIVFNLCRSYGYQTLGYYVSLLAAARGHRPLPSVSTLQDLRLAPVIRLASQDLDDLIQSSLRRLRGRSFELSVYFGRNLAKRYDRLSRALFNQFPAPLLRARFRRRGRWELERLRPIATSEIPDSHREFVIDRAVEYLARPRRRARGKPVYRYDLAILVNPDEEEPPSNRRAIRKFVDAAADLGLDATLIQPDDYGRIAEFDALFIRETTYVDHHTFRFSRRAAAEGLFVVDDPESILRCTNKVFLAEAFARVGLACPRTLVVGSDDAARIEKEVGLPCVIKRPDSSFSQGVSRAETPEELRVHLAAALERSELAVAQEFVPSSFDWRVGVLDGEVLYACRYYMAPGHWQIISRDGDDRRYGKVETPPLEEVPPQILDLARRSAAVVGRGFYGVDLKQAGERCVVMEVNDNPNVDAGYEDHLLGDALYTAVMRHFRERLDARGA